MKVIKAKVMNNPSEEAIDQFHKRLAKILVNDIGIEKCEAVIKEYKKNKEKEGKL